MKIINAVNILYITCGGKMYIAMIIENGKLGFPGGRIDKNDVVEVEYIKKNKYVLNIINNYSLIDNYSTPTNPSFLQKKEHNLHTIANINPTNNPICDSCNPIGGSCNKISTNKIVTNKIVTTLVNNENINDRYITTDITTTTNQITNTTNNTIINNQSISKNLASNIMTTNFATKMNLTRYQLILGYIASLRELYEEMHIKKMESLYKYMLVRSEKGNYIFVNFIKTDKTEVDEYHKRRNFIKNNNGECQYLETTGYELIEVDNFMNNIKTMTTNEYGLSFKTKSILKKLNHVNLKNIYI